MKLLVSFICLSLLLCLPWINCHGHSHDNDGEAPSFKWSKAANTPNDEDLTLDEEGLDLDNIETITGHGHAHVVTEKPHGGHGHAHGGHGHAHGGHGHAHGGHGHSHGGHGHSHGSQREPTEEEREKFRKKLHANWDDDEDDQGSNTSTIWFNAMMSTLLISAAPFFILFFIPLDKSQEKQWLLKILLAFASGGLLGDAFLHLIPHAMMAAETEGGDHHGHHHGHSHGGEEGGHVHDMSVGLGVLSGILAFLVVEKVVRIMKGGHSHSHNVAPADKPKEKPVKEKKKTKDSDGEDESKVSEKKVTKETKEKEKEKASEKEAESSDDDEEIKVAGFLNLAADMFHNFTDGLAVGASYLAGDSIGLITTITILFHEIPHEIGDFAILIQSGVPRGKAIALQALTAVGAVTGCALSLLLGGATDAAASLTLPFTAGGFIYIATVSVIPELLEGSSLKQTAMEVAAMLVGVGMMVIIAQYE